VTSDIDELTRDEMVGRDLRANIQKSIFSDAELGDLRLGLHFSLCKMATLRLGDILRLRNASTKLHGYITISVNFATGYDLVAFKSQNGDGHMAAIILE
jgi:hypothetical protein